MLALTFQVGPDRVAVDVRRVREVVPRVRLVAGQRRAAVDRRRVRLPRPGRAGRRSAPADRRRRVPAPPQQPDHPVAVPARCAGIARRAARHAGRRHPRDPTGARCGRSPASPTARASARRCRTARASCASSTPTALLGQVAAGSGGLDRRGGDRMSLPGVEAVVRDRLGLDPAALGATALPRRGRRPDERTRRDDDRRLPRDR